MKIITGIGNKKRAKWQRQGTEEWTSMIKSR